MDLLTILTIILIISAAVLCIALIFYIGRIVKSVTALENNIKDLSASLKPLISSTTELTENLNRISVEAKTQLQVSKSILNDFRDRADKILHIEQKLRGGFEDAVTPLVQNLSAIGKGFETFWRKFKER